MLATIAAKLPPPEQRPRVGLVMYSKTGFLPYIMARGFGAEQYRAVGAVDAFSNIPHMAYKDGGGATRLDLEGMLSIDPDVLITPFAVMPGMRSNHDQLLTLQNDPLGKRLKAIRNGRVYPGGTPLQGPLFLLFQVEMAAKQIYPEQFGPYRDDQRYPKNEQLFDRQRVSAVLTDKAPGGDGQ
jgi:ABC-type Fe3+-hydroxamate transport system substrate-binding protein